jgi:betaine-aldehyde dehydrogenase
VENRRWLFLMIVTFDSAVNAALAANFYSTGQVCSNGTRVFVHEAIYDAFVSEVVARSNAIVVGDPFDPATQMGPLVSQQQLEKVAGYLSEVRHSDDVSLLCGGDIDFDSALSGGYYVSPAVVVTDNEAHAVVTDEVFGPVMSVLKFADEADVVSRANSTKLGLAAAVFSQNFLVSASSRQLPLQAGYCLDQRIQHHPRRNSIWGLQGVGDRSGKRTPDH